MALATVGIISAIGHTFGLGGKPKLAPPPVPFAMQPGVGPAPTPPPTTAASTSSGTALANTAAEIARRKAAGGSLLTSPVIGAARAGSGAVKTLLGF